MPFNDRSGKTIIEKNKLFTYRTFFKGMVNYQPLIIEVEEEVAKKIFDQLKKNIRIMKSLLGRVKRQIFLQYF
jgi:hypothetical protein